MATTKLQMSSRYGKKVATVAKVAGAIDVLIRKSMAVAAYDAMMQRIGEDVVCNTIRLNYPNELILNAVREHLATAPPSPPSWDEVARYCRAIPKAWRGWEERTRKSERENEEDRRVSMWAEWMPEGQGS